jgi:hypothetical protein
MSRISEEFAKSAQIWNRPSWRNLLVVVPWAVGLIWCIYGFKEDRDIARRQQTTYGIVTKNEPSNHNRYGYEFSVDGKPRTGWQIPSRVEFQIGQRVLVFYDPLDPRTSSLYDFTESADSALGPVPFLVFGIVAVTAFIFWRRRNSVAELNANRSDS